METEYERDILPFREFEPETEIFDCHLCHEPVDEDEAVMMQTDVNHYEPIHKLCLKKYDPWTYWMARYG